MQGLASGVGRLLGQSHVPFGSRAILVGSKHSRPNTQRPGPKTPGATVWFLTDVDRRPSRFLLPFSGLVR
jgi:hypothetical protein